MRSNVSFPHSRSVAIPAEPSFRNAILVLGWARFVSAANVLQQGKLLGCKEALRGEPEQTLLHARHTSYIRRRFTVSRQTSLLVHFTLAIRIGSQAFKKSHGGGGGGKTEGDGGGKPGYIAAGGMGKIRELIVEPPIPALYNAPIIEPVPPEHQGGLWEFEDEPSYFDGDL